MFVIIIRGRQTRFNLISRSVSTQSALLQSQKIRDRRKMDERRILILSIGHPRRCSKIFVEKLFVIRTNSRRFYASSWRAKQRTICERCERKSNESKGSATSMFDENDRVAAADFLFRRAPRGSRYCRLKRLILHLFSRILYHNPE